MADSRVQFWLWRPRQLTWWIATLFMIGSAHFAAGSLLFLGGSTHELTLDTVFFAGSLFFTSAAYCQFHQAQNAMSQVDRQTSLSGASIPYWAAASQLVGTLMFNLNTFDAFFDLGWLERELVVWTPNILGSVLFMISGSLAMLQGCGRWWCWRPSSIGWWINAINYLGSIAFLFSAVLAFVTWGPASATLAIWSTIFTLTGALCFFSAAFLMWPQLSAQLKKQN